MTSYWKDIDISLDMKNSGDIKDDIDLDAIENSLTNIVKTFQGTRRMLPTFALGIYNYLFEPIDEITAYEIGERMLEAINDWDDRVIVDDLLVEPKHDQNMYNIELTFRVGDFEEQRTINTILYSL